MSTPSTTTVVPTQEQDLPEVGQFLHENLGRRFTQQAWIDSLTQRWAAESPNYGTHLRHDGRVVGVLCAIYSDQPIDGQLVKVCNPHSWVVLEEHRNHSIGLLLQLLRQRGLHFTMFTPNPKVAQVFKGLRFRVLDETVLHVPHLPSPRALLSGGVVETRRAQIAALLDEPARLDFEAHAHLPWLNFVAFGEPGAMALVVYKPARWKKLRCAAISHLSDAGVMQRHGHLLRHHLLVRHGFAVSRVESRFVPGGLPLAIRSQRTQPKLVLSTLLQDHQVRDLYSELMALDL
jgi:hypothetical protein